MAVTKNQSDSVSLDLLNTITKGIDFSVPDVDLTDSSLSIPQSVIDALGKAPNSLNTNDLTTRTINGGGVFDAIMQAVKVHLLEEYEKGRITGAEYTKAYSSIVGVAIQSAVQFCLNRDKAYWDAIGAQINAVTANIGTNTAKVQLAIAKAQAHQNKAQYALTVLKLGTEDAQFALVRENFEAVRGQTCDKRTDGTVIVGAMGKQKDLYNQQIDSYKRDAETKAGKLFTDAWITQKGIDEGLTAPTALQNASVDKILSVIKQNNGLV